MPSSYTNLLGLVLPTTGELNGTWGAVVNANQTQFVEDAVAGYATASVAGGDWTLTTTGGGIANEARMSTLIATGSPGVPRSIFAPKLSKTYTVINKTNAVVTIKGGPGTPTTGVAVAVGTASVVVWDTVTGDFIMAGAPAGSYATAGANSDITSWSGGALAGLRNRLINGAMAIDQEFAGASTTFTAGAALKYAIDQWYAYCTGANVTGLRVAGTAPNQYNYQFTGAASVTKIGYAQRMEAVNTQDLAGTTATLSVDLANTLLTTVTWTAWRANTANTFGTLASPTRTQIGTGTFTVTGTLTRYSAQITVTAASTTGIEVEFSVGAQTSGTFTIGRAQLEQGGTATAFESTCPFSLGLLLCQRYFAKTFAQNTVPAQNTGIFVGSLGGSVMSTSFIGNCFVMWRFPVVMRATPTISLFTPGASGIGCFSDSAASFSTGLANNPSDSGTQIYNSGGGLTANSFAYIHATATARIP